MENIDEFVKEIKKIGMHAQTSVSYKDYLHMRYISFFGTVLFWLGLSFCFFNHWIMGGILLSQHLLVKWLLMHHIGHGGYNRIKNIPRRFHSSHYAQGYRRYLDWFDWIRADAWNYEHNYLHHTFTGENKDPDLVENNLDWLASMKQPILIKWLILIIAAASWKFTYYSPRTLSYLKGYQKIHIYNFLNIKQKAPRHMWLELFLPYIGFHFIALPFLCEWIATGFGWSVLYARILAELFHNIQMFIVIVPNHSGADLYRFDNVNQYKHRNSEYYIRQILGSANYHNGAEWIDFLHMYLNYQIEHHLFPNLPMRQYRLIQPQIQSVCQKYNVPYIQESVWVRLIKMVNVAIGRQKMRRISGPFSP
ncbi:fatty acid desaturase family protein [Shewanella surugensis]|uniref:Fatty acid desaturase n=1 Tax=Shewanella surugensis TaxID=212020 RepID=A0ABT0LA01_9GAMM|nr:fatty acid desaturase [Shewanella surugensis]MCL1124522.1 fatty acid desaturase [Shewanella surugensis]